MISSNEVCGEHEITTRLIQKLSSRCWRRSPREIDLSGILESSKNKIYKIGPIGDRPGKVWLESSGIWNFLALYCHRSEYTADPTYYTCVYVVCTSTRSQCKRNFYHFDVLLYTPSKLLISDETLGIPFNFMLLFCVGWNNSNSFPALPQAWVLANAGTHAEPLHSININAAVLKHI